MFNSRFLFHNSTAKSRQERSELRTQLAEILEVNEDKLSEDVFKKAKYAFLNAGVSGLKVALKLITKDLTGPLVGPKTKYIVVSGNTYNHRDELKRLQFRITKVDNTWLHYLKVQEDKAQYWMKAINDIDANLFVFSSDSVRAVLPLLKEAIELDKTEAPKPKVGIIKHELTGRVLEMSKWFANILQENTTSPIKFRNIKIKAVKRETEKAYLMDIEYYSGVVSSCGCCGLPLTNDVSRMTGIGPICAGKLNMPRPTMKNAKQFMKDLDEKFKTLGTFKEVWIPKSQIKRTNEGENNGPNND